MSGFATCFNNNISHLSFPKKLVSLCFDTLIFLHILIFAKTSNSFISPRLKLKLMQAEMGGGDGSGSDDGSDSD